MSTVRFFRLAHRHLSNIDCLMACTACLVFFMSTVKWPQQKKPWKTGASSGNITNLKQSIFVFQYLWASLIHKSNTPKWSSLLCTTSIPHPQILDCNKKTFQEQTLQLIFAPPFLTKKKSFWALAPWMEKWVWFLDNH